MSNSVDPDETPRSAASHLGLHCLLRPVCPKTYDKYGMRTLARTPSLPPREITLRNEYLPLSSLGMGTSKGLHEVNSF